MAMNLEICVPLHEGRNNRFLFLERVNQKVLSKTNDPFKNSVESNVIFCKFFESQINNKTIVKWVEMGLCPKKSPAMVVSI